MPGDVIVGDAEGVMVVPAALAEEVARDALEQELREELALERVGRESIDGVYPLADGPSGREFEGLACDRANRDAKESVSVSFAPTRRDPGRDPPARHAVHPDGELDLRARAPLVEWQLENGSHGISVGGSTGEPSSQSVEERIAVIQAASRAVADRVPFFPGTGSAHMDETLEVTAAAERLGADAVLVDHAVLQPAHATGAVRLVLDGGARVPRACRSIVYNVPVRAAVDIAPETVARLRRAHENIVGIKETTRDFEHVSTCWTSAGGTSSSTAGSSCSATRCSTIGGVGHLSCVANVAREPCAELYDAFVAGDLGGGDRGCTTRCTRSSRWPSWRRTPGPSSGRWSSSRGAPPAGALLPRGRKKTLCGRPVSARGREGRTFETLDPTTNEPIVDVAEGLAVDVDDAVVAARHAFDEGRGRG